jgi:hypothetical protein
MFAPLQTASVPASLPQYGSDQHPVRCLLATMHVHGTQEHLPDQEHHLLPDQPSPAFVETQETQQAQYNHYGMLTSNSVLAQQGENCRNSSSLENGQLLQTALPASSICSHNPRYSVEGTQHPGCTQPHLKDYCPCSGSHSNLDSSSSIT